KWKDGVSTYLALTFGTLLSSQGTDASFGFPSGLPPGASLRCFRLYQTLFRSVSGPDSKSDSPLPPQSTTPTFARQHCPVSQRGD
ncbi:hypothetical protein FNX44_022480, partial [Streptomyces sp. OF1]|nr:hypothetical protein [Streptomyces alkaliterrae]